MYTCSQRGGRPVNEDAVAFGTLGEAGAFLLADGLGGHAGGAVASQIVTQTMLSDLRRLLEAREAFEPALLEGSFLRANALLLERQQDPGPNAMMTTAVALIIQNGRALWGHVGDSRLYYFSGGRLAAVTRDHSVSYKKYLCGEITLRELHTDEDRSSLLQAVGSRMRCIPELADKVQEISAGDAFLICSDGLWEYVFQEEIESDLASSETPEEWAKRLLCRRECRADSNCDNYSLISLFIQ